MVLIALGIFYTLKRWSNIKLFTKIGVVCFTIVVAVYLLAPFLYKQCTSVFQDKIYIFLNNEWTLWTILGLGVVLILLAWIYGSLLTKNRSLIKKIITFLALGALVLLLSHLYYGAVINPYGGIGGGVAHIASGGDGRRASDLRSLQLSLEFYLDKHNQYPDSLAKLVPDFVKNVPTDYATNAPYDYRTSVDQSTYVLKTVFGTHKQTCRDEHYVSKHNVVLNYLKRAPDLDGNVLGLDCNDPAYCIGP
jgi:hypothetical protein